MGIGRFLRENLLGIIKETRYFQASFCSPTGAVIAIFSLFLDSETETGAVMAIGSFIVLDQNIYPASWRNHAFIAALCGPSTNTKAWIIGEISRISTPPSSIREEIIRGFSIFLVAQNDHANHKTSNTNTIDKIIYTIFMVPRKENKYEHYQYTQAIPISKQIFP
jgi:hypothetical protein